MSDSSNYCSVCDCVVSSIWLEHVSLVRLTQNEKFGVTSINFNIIKGGFKLNYVHTRHTCFVV